MDDMMMAKLMFRAVDYQRGLTSDRLVKSSLPNSSDFLGGELDFAGVMRELTERADAGSPSATEQADTLERYTRTSPVTESVRDISTELTQDQIQTTGMIRLLNHLITQERSTINNFRPQ